VAFSSRIERGCVLVASSVGRYTYLASDVYLNYTTIGNYCSIAAGAKIGGMEHSWWWGCTSERLSPYNIDGRRTTIGDDVWIGSHVVVRQGVHIGRGAVIGAGSIVLKDVPPYTMVAGVPARELRKRFTQEVIGQVVATRFWEHPPDKARLLLQDIHFERPHPREGPG
jgi:acetyltransferase-like isoleucine patch superfamily enzyme